MDNSQKNMSSSRVSSYQATPIIKHGYVPPTALKNRHNPQHIVQMPMGQQHFSRIGRKYFPNNCQISTIKQQNLLTSPEQYPYQNRIALDKKYPRNLTTIDIVGASPGSIMSQAVRYKMKARQQLNNKKYSNNQSHSYHSQPVKLTGIAYQQQQRKKIAYQQFMNHQQNKYHNKKKNLSQMQIQNQYQFNYDNNSSNNYHNIQKNIQNNHTPSNYHKSNRGYYLSEQKPTKYHNIQPQKPNSALHDNQLSQMFHPITSNQRSKSPLTPNPPQLQNNQDLLQQQPPLPTPKQKPKYLHNQSTKLYQSPYLQFPIDKKLARLINPTNLSTQNSIFLAGRNLILNK